MNSSGKNAEQLKHRFALELEAKKWNYRRQELQYLEAGQHLRSLNQLMWQVPSMAIAVTGGLWYGATTVESDAPRAWVFGFTAFVDVLIVIIIWRLRSLIEKHIQHQEAFAGEGGSRGRLRYVVISCWIFALIAAAVVSAAGAFNPSVIAKKSDEKKSVPCCNVTVDVPPIQVVAPQQCVAPRKVAPRKKEPCSQ